MSFNDWKKVRIGKLGEIVSGGTPSTRIINFWDGLIPWITPRDLSGYQERLISHGERFISEEGLYNSSAKLMPEGTVLFSSRAPIGYIAIANNEITTNQGFKNIIVNRDNYNLFVYYLLKFKTEDIKRIAGGSTFSEISGKNFKNFEVNIPDLSTQIKIADFLGSLDEKIELNNKINKTLEELAQTLYKHWFVDFEFPNEEGKPYKSSGGEMVESELGMIPKGWEVKKVNELFVFIGGSQPPKSEHIYEAKDGYVRFLQNRDYRDNSNHLTYIKVAKRNKLAEKYDILMDKYGEVGQIRFGLEGAYNVALAKIEPVDSVDLEYLRGYFSQKSITAYLENSSIASTRGSLNATTFTGLKVPYPSNELRFSFLEIQFKTLELILNFKSQNQQLSTLRDLLLPKLMSGEIEV
jgi:type I restriction enzyme, S subunit